MLCPTHVSLDLGLIHVFRAGAISATFNGNKLGTVAGSCVPPDPIVFPGHGMVGLGCGAYHYAQFKDFAISAK